MKISDVVKLLILLAEIMDILGKYADVNDKKMAWEAAQKHGVSFQELWRRMQKNN
ncbi:hypothetical protein [Paenibacillus sp. FSL R10-2736]|uniref:hypothetical protein n=1 Tax=Paenibacillus sp. FSL R10-2736 TaxID=2954692 RepID=UPI0030F98341